MNTEGLSEVRLDRIHDVMADYVERGEVLGLGMLVSGRTSVAGQGYDAHQRALGSTRHTQ